MSISLALAREPEHEVRRRAAGEARRGGRYPQPPRRKPGWVRNYGAKAALPCEYALRIYFCRASTLFEFTFTLSAFWSLSAPFYEKLPTPDPEFSPLWVGGWRPASIRDPNELGRNFELEDRVPKGKASKILWRGESLPRSLESRV